MSTFIIIPFMMTSYVTSSICPSGSSCDCKKEHQVRKDSDKDYIVINCELSVTEDDIHVFANTSIRRLKLHNTTMTNLVAGTFKDINVETLTVHDQVTKIESDTFADIMDTLTTLKLININISRNWDLNFLKDLKISRLYLDQNGIYPEHFPELVFSNLSLGSLKHLSLKNCKIVDIMDNSFQGLEHLDTLDISYNNIPKIASWILRLKNLRKINMSNNKRLIYIGDNAFYSLTKLEEIDLSNTGINAILEHAFNGLEHSLHTLKLRHAQLQDGHFNTMKHLKRLKTLDLSYNKIVDMHNTSFIGFSSLQSLDVSGQRDIRDGHQVSLNFVDSAFRGLDRKLLILKIRDLMMTSLPLAALSSLQVLEELDASQNEFTEIYDDFFYKVNARVIYLRDMDISYIQPNAFMDLKLGSEVFLDNNDIKNMSFILETRKCQFLTLSLKNNSVDCSCDVVEIALTNRVRHLEGTCADGFFKGEPLRRVHKLPLAQTMCDISNLRNDTNCKYTGVSRASHFTIYKLYFHTLFFILAVVDFK